MLRSAASVCHMRIGTLAGLKATVSPRLLGRQSWSDNVRVLSNYSNDDDPNGIGNLC